MFPSPLQVEQPSTVYSLCRENDSPIHIKVWTALEERLFSYSELWHPSDAVTTNHCGRALSRRGGFMENTRTKAALDLEAIITRFLECTNKELLF